MRSLPRLSLLTLLLALAGCVDVPPPVDAGVPPDMAATADMPNGFERADGGGPACVPAEEVCNGVDDDCDGRLDERDPTQCDRCVRAGEVGPCAEGRMICADGLMQCAAVGAPPSTGCDLIDGDCDGRWDEAGEEPALRDVRVVRQCPDTVPQWGPADGSGRCEAPGEVGCGAPHPCLDRPCVDGCIERLGLDYARCAADCPPGADNRPCRTACRDDADAIQKACIADCPPDRPGVERWSCVPGPAGPACGIAACADGSALDDDRCAAFEVCNNGVDEDGDGVIDGSAADPGPCEAVFVQTPPAPIGSCPEGIPGCDGVVGTPHPLWSCAEGCPYAPQLDYDFALDREEVSNRAWAACVDAGACVEPAGLAWRQAKVLIDSGVTPPRPDSPTCAEPVRLDPRVGADIDPRVVDLPVTGVTWCQARNYCLWAGKRLPSEVEWERAASGAQPRRLWPWGDVAPAACDAAQCCGTEGERPASCPAGPLPTCPEAPAGGPIRVACQATLGQSDPTCNPAPANCAECLPSPAPVWANPDGATPEGVLNLAGNVSEWTFDWASLGYADAVTLDPVGAPCDELSRVPAGADPQNRALVGPSQRVTRGGDYLRNGLPAEVMARSPFPPGAQVPAVGFRCGRTVQLDDFGRPTVCDPGTQGADVQPAGDGRPLCAAPDFDDDLGAFGVCPNNRRAPSRTCVEGQGRTCATDTPMGCGVWMARSLKLAFGRLDALVAAVLSIAPFGVDFESPTLDPVAAEFIGRLFDGDLVPNGGRSLIALDTGCGFGDDNLYRARLVNGTQVGGELYEMGLIEGADCRPLATPEIPIGTQSVGVVDNVCALGRGEFYVEGLGAKLPYSGLMVYGIDLDRLRGRLTGAMLYIVNQRDAADSTLGDDAQGAVRDFLTGIGAPAQDLCFLQQMGALIDPNINQQADPADLERAVGRWNCAAFVGWPGCQQGTCVGIGGDTSMCTGWVAPIEVQATARETTDLGYAPCSCDPESAVGPGGPPE